MGTRYTGTADERRALDAFIKLKRAAETISTRLQPLLAAHGLSESQFGVMEALLHLGPMCQKDLGEKLLRSCGNITMVVDNLEKRHLIQRVRSTEDRRFINVSLTDSGREQISRLFPDHVANVVQAMDVLDADDQERLGQLCRQLGRGQRRIEGSPAG
jgi:MarR family transcriptional regulator, 2-MHQ and catechol-resistance regulon repressor